MQKGIFYYGNTSYQVRYILLTESLDTILANKSAQLQIFAKQLCQTSVIAILLVITWNIYYWKYYMGPHLLVG